MAREKVTFEPNETQIVRLEYNDGREVEGKGGPQWQYFLHEDKIMWVDAEVRQKIRNIGAGANSEIAITKVKKGKNSPWWTVEEVQDETGHIPTAQPAAAALTPPPVNGTALTGADYAHARATVAHIDRGNNGKNGAANGAAPDAVSTLRPAAPLPAPTARAGDPWFPAAKPEPAAQPSQFNGSPKRDTSNGVAHTPAPQPATGNRQPATEANRITPATAQLAAALMAAIDAGREAMLYAERKGITLEFAASDYRAMANTIQIHSEHSGGGR